MNQNEIDESHFYMWRTLFAVVHVENTATEEEIEFMVHVLDKLNFSDQQTEVLKKDIYQAQDAQEMFNGVTEHKDRTEFFECARDLVWVDDDFDSGEQSVMIKLHQDHIKRTNVDEMVGGVSLELEEDLSPPPRNNKPLSQKQSTWKRLAGILKGR